MIVDVPKGKKSGAHTKFCIEWLSMAAEMRSLLYTNGNFILSLGELASVGFLATGAVKTGFHAFPEFAEDNRKLT